MNDMNALLQSED